MSRIASVLAQLLVQTIVVAARETSAVRESERDDLDSDFDSDEDREWVKRRQRALDMVQLALDDVNDSTFKGGYRRDAPETAAKIRRKIEKAYMLRDEDDMEEAEDLAKEFLRDGWVVIIF